MVATTRPPRTCWFAARVGAWAVLLGAGVLPLWAAGPSSHQAATAALSGSPAQSTPTSETTADQKDEEQMLLALAHWLEALLSNDAGQIAPFYAAKVDRYFLRTDVDRDYVRNYLMTEEARGVRLKAYYAGDVSIERKPEGWAELRFLASFTVMMPDGKRVSSTRTVLRMRKEEGDWKIFYERDLKG